MADEFLTVTTYLDAIVPDWIANVGYATGYDGEAIRKAFREGVEAALNIECKGECAKPSVSVVNAGDAEPDRDAPWIDSDGDTWSCKDDEWGWTGRLSMEWYAVGGWWQNPCKGSFPLTRVV